MKTADTCRYQFCPNFTKNPLVMTVFTGRSEEVRRIVHGVFSGHNFLIEGETRIGKTFLLHFLDDCTNGQINTYLKDLIDRELKAEIDGLADLFNKLIFINISLHALNDINTFLSTAIEKMLKSLNQQSLFGFSQTMTVNIFLSIVESIISPCLQGKKIILMFDEFEKITTAGYKRKKGELLGCLTELIQTFPNIRLLVAGWNGMEERIRKEGVKNISDFLDQFSRKIYLPPLPQKSTRTLISTIGKSVFEESVPSKLIDRSITFTGCRPHYVQRYFDIICEKVKILKKFTVMDFKDPIICRSEIEDELLEDSKYTIGSALQLNDKKSRTLNSIAQYPGCTIENLKIFLDETVTAADIRELEKFYFVLKDNRFYFIRGELYRLWIIKNVRNSFIKPGKTPPVVNSELDFIDFIEKLILQFKHLVEEKKGYKLLWKGSQKPALEENSQILFNLLFEKYAGHYGVFLSREIETGRGPVDFKFTGGFDWTAHLEIKRGNSTKLRHGLKHQLPIYLKADDVKYGFYLIISYNNKELKKAELLSEESRDIEKKMGIILRT